MSEAVATSITIPRPFSVGGPSAARRRAVLTGTAAVAAALASCSIARAEAAPASPDAELIALCAEMDAMQRRIDAMFDSTISSMSFEEADAASAVIEVDQLPILDRICAMTPVTMAGCQALARSLALVTSGHPEPGPDATTDRRLTFALLRGLTGSAAA